MSDPLADLVEGYQGPGIPVVFHGYRPRLLGHMSEAASQDNDLRRRIADTLMLEHRLTARFISLGQLRGTDKRLVVCHGS